MSDPLDPALVSAIRAKAAAAPCIASLGLDLLDFGPGHCRLFARRDPRFDGVLPGFHGGMMAAVADCVAWFAIVTRTGPDETLLTTDMNIRYLAPCRTDLLAAGRIIKLGRTLCPVQIELFDADGAMVACGQVTYIRADNVKR